MLIWPLFLDSAMNAEIIYSEILYQNHDEILIDIEWATFLKKNQ